MENQRLTEYERIRLENIKRNDEILALILLPSISPTGISLHTDVDIHINTAQNEAC